MAVYKKISFTFLNVAMHTTDSVHLIRIDLVISTVLGKEYEL
jgi:hypothetical protein